VRIAGGILSILSGIPIFFVGVFVAWMGGFASYVVGGSAASIAVTGIAWFLMGPCRRYMYGNRTYLVLSCNNSVIADTNNGCAGCNLFGKEPQ